MGLDMFLCIDDGVGEQEIGYWRKHPNLHGFIVNEFADGVDECQKIYLTRADLRRILDAVKEDALPHTDGFFFGASRPEHKEQTIEILERAIDFLKKPHPRDARVYYQASW